jgi:hypothetical protein
VRLVSLSGSYDSLRSQSAESSACDRSCSDLGLGGAVAAS